MIFHDWKAAPNPRRVRIFLAEKGIEVPTEDVGDGMVLKAAYVEKYPEALVPMLELDDGTQIGEAMAICRYFEDLHPEPPLMGRDARDKALTEMWERRAFDGGMVSEAEVFRNSHPGFADRGLPGIATPIPQIPALIDRGRARLAQFFARFEAQLADNPFVAGAAYSVADITTLCVIDFCKFTKDVIPDDCPNFARWYGEVSARPSASA